MPGVQEATWLGAVQVKKILAVTIAGLALTAGFVQPAQARKGPKVYDQARAIPTQSGENVRITLYTKGLRGLKVRVDDSREMRAIRFGTGCGELRCQRWKVYAERKNDECYDVTFTNIGRPGEPGLAGALTVCEPFRNGSV